MDKHVFTTCMDTIYAVHGKTLRAAAMDYIFERIKTKPNDFIRWAEQEICQRDKFPANMLVELDMELFHRWLSVTGRFNREQACCPDCDTETPGFFTAWDVQQDGSFHRFVCKCSCNNGNQFRGMDRMSKTQARQRGLEVMSAGCNSTFFFETTRLCGGRVYDAEAIRETIRKAFKAKEEPRGEHADYMAQEEYGF